MDILQRIDKRFRLLREQQQSLDWKDVGVLRAYGERDEISPGYHALRATAGPATPNPVWAMDWEAPNGYVYKKGTPAPHWTEEEIYWAMKPQLRIWARAAARRSVGGMHGGKVDPNAVDDAEDNMAVELIKMLRQEVDQGRILSGGGFVSYVTVRVREAGLTGVGGDTGMRNALGRVGDLLRTDNPKFAQQVADMVQPPFDTQKSHKKDPGNPFGMFSPDIHQLATQLAQALASGNAQAVQAVKAKLTELDDGKGEYGGGRIKDAMTVTQGVDTGRKIISTPHGAKSDSDAKRDLEWLYRTKVSSMDAPAGPESDVPLGDTIAGDEGIDLRGMDKEIIYNALKLGRGMLRSKEKPREMRALAQQGLKPIDDGDFRYLIRLLAPWLPGGRYPGKGQTNNFPYNDPEIDPQTGNTSGWLQRGMQLQNVPWSSDRLEIMNDIISGGPVQYGGAGQPSLATITGGAKLTPAETEILEMLLGLHASTKEPLSQAQVSRLRGISKMRVNNVVKAVVQKTGKTIADMLEQAKQAQAGGGQAQPAAQLQVSQDPFSVFMAWMNEYREAEGLDESRYIEVAMISECIRMLNKLNWYMTVYPIITNDRRRIVLHEGRAIRR